MGATLLRLYDDARDRLLPTTVYLPASGARKSPLIVFGHGMWGHPRKFTWLFGRWAEAGYAVAAPAFPRTSDEDAPQSALAEVVNQPADVSFVVDQLLARGIGDAGRVGVAGYSLGAETALAVGLHPRCGDGRIRAVVAIAGALFHPDFAADTLRPLPLLLIHGAEDTKRGRLREALKTYATAQEPKQLVMIEGAGHGICEDDDPRPYAARVAEISAAFWDRYLRTQRPALDRSDLSFAWASARECPPTAALHTAATFERLPRLTGRRLDNGLHRPEAGSRA